MVALGSMLIQASVNVILLSLPYYESLLPQRVYLSSSMYVGVRACGFYVWRWMCMRACVGCSFSTDTVQ